jgi:hypothetical protein
MTNNLLMDAVVVKLGQLTFENVSQAFRLEQVVAENLRLADALEASQRNHRETVRELELANARILELERGLDLPPDALSGSTTPLE